VKRINEVWKIEIEFFDPIGVIETKIELLYSFGKIMMFSNETLHIKRKRCEKSDISGRIF
jgi:hypothetical protein